MLSWAGRVRAPAPYVFCDYPWVSIDSRSSTPMHGTAPYVFPDYPYASTNPRSSAPNGGK